jgi:hypothetical protein
MALSGAEKQRRHRAKVKLELAELKRRAAAADRQPINGVDERAPLYAEREPQPVATIDDDRLPAHARRQPSGKGSRGRVRVLPPAMIAAQFKPGQSGNPNGRGHFHAQALRMARDMTPAAIRRLGELGGLLPGPDGEWIPLDRLGVDARVTVDKSP